MISIALVMLVIGAAAFLSRVLAGPTIPDRVVALDGLLSVVVIGIIVVINNRKLMGKHAAGYFLNAMLGLAFLFSVLISYNGILAVRTQLG